MNSFRIPLLVLLCDQQCVQFLSRACRQKCDNCSTTTYVASYIFLATLA